MQTRILLGAIFIILGAYLFLNQGESMGPGSLIGHFWPSIFVIPLGVFFHWLYFGVTGRRGSGLLIPGGILVVVGAVCQIATLFDNWGYMWPGFIMAPAVGLLEFYWFGSRNKWLLIPINVLGVLSLLFFAVFSIGTLLNQLMTGQPFIAVALILIGAFVLLSKKREM